MREIMHLKAERKAELLRHPFYSRWVRASGIPAEKKLLFAPIMINFVMNFRDINKWFLRFPQPTNQFEKIINGNTLEDETHSRLFLEDWEKLRFDETLGWGAGDTLWWMFLAEDTEPFRRYGMQFSRMSVVDGGDPLVRFAHSEAGEACGHAFFTHVSTNATAFKAATGIDCRYFGVYHLNKEPGHVLESEGVFENQHLDPRQRQLALALENEMFEIFLGMHDAFLRYAEMYVARNVVPRRAKRAPGVMATKSAPPPEPPESGRMTPYHAEVQRALDMRKSRTAEHPFFAWLQDEDSVSPKQKLQRFIPMWVMDIMGYRDLNRYGMRYPNPANSQELVINRWVDSLQTHSALFLNDWDALRMDELLGWAAGDTLRFCFLDAGMDVHRHNIAKFIKLAFRYPKPVLRYWLLEALESSGEAFFANTRALASAVEEKSSLRLDYLADRHDVTSECGADRAPKNFAFFKREPITPEERDIAIGMIDTVFDAVDEQLSISHEMARRNRFGVGDNPLSGAAAASQRKRRHEMHPTSAPGWLSPPANPAYRNPR